jgi:ferritin-like metal-binding protein YciE
MARKKDLHELFHEALKDIYFAEKKILSTLPKMAKAAQSEELKAAFEKHEGETEEHVARLDQVFEEIEETPRGKSCEAIMGIIEEGQEVMKEFNGAPALDAGLLAAAQAVEHYEIARYGTLKTWAAELGLDRAFKLLETTLAEEKKTDETLSLPESGYSRRRVRNQRVSGDVTKGRRPHGHSGVRCRRSDQGRNRADHCRCKLAR